jgi:two-component system, LytTR family, sensor kinase
MIRSERPPLAATLDPPSAAGPRTAAHRARWLAVALIAGGWGIAALVYATHLYLYHTLRGARTTMGFQLLEALAHFGPWAALTPLVLYLARRWPLLDRGWPRRLFLHVAVGAVVALLQLALHAALDHGLLHGAAGGWEGLLDRFGKLLARTYYANLLVYLALVVGAAAIERSRRARAREAELERALTQSQLDALRLQLQPHFLFNALNAVSGLIADEPDMAQRMVARLADLLRLALDPANAGEVSLARELELARAYLAIEEVRFGERLTVVVSVEPGVERAAVPGLLLQPLLENAVRHGIARQRGAGRLELRAERHDGRVRLTVRDDGGGPDGVATPGIGFANVTSRLQRIYGEDHGFSFGPAPGGGSEAVVEVPWRPLP